MRPHQKSKSSDNFGVVFLVEQSNVFHHGSGNMSEVTHVVDLQEFGHGGGAPIL